ncbi:TPA: methyltetrahydrofolate cobalamin methyltransferase [Candidatus Poribacteria bacterium]|nr:methyltetrahydrofolate cobalamin methyltransferase [Candidatus Poribacteria bacterium]
MLIIGELINCTRKRIAGAVEKKDVGYIQKVAQDQIASGADILDVNAGIAGMEVELLPWLVETIQAVTDVQLCIDSADGEAIAAALPVCKKKPMINSITDEAKIVDIILPLVVENKTQVIALCTSDEVSGETADDRLQIASSLVGKLTDAGVPPEDIYVDPCVYPISTNVNSGIEFLHALEQMKDCCEGVHTVCGLSNISFGLPTRKILNQVFMIMAMVKGLDAALLDPRDKRMMADIIAAEALLGQDDFCMNYIQAYRKGILNLED